MKQVKVEWCENFIKATFKRIHSHVGPYGGIEFNYFWETASRAGLWKPGIYDGPMIHALVELTETEPIYNDEGEYLYTVFRLKGSKHRPRRRGID